MPNTVIWLAGPLNALAQIWTQAPDRQAVADAADEIDRLLGLVPTSVGVPHGSFRLLRIDPLEVLYSVSLDDCRVTVTFVRFRP
jgi:hypothetical protein